MSRKLLGRAAVAAIALSAAGASAETLIFATDLPPNHVLSVSGAEPLMACISERTNGAIDFNYMPSGQLVKRNQMVESLNKGMAQIAMSALANETATMPAQGVVMLPGMSESAREGTVAWRAALDADGEMMRELKDRRVYPIFLNVLPPYQIMGKEKLDDIALWQGKKIRATGSALVVLAQAVGATPVQLPATELFVAMQQGVVDGTILSFASVPPYSIHEVATHYSTNTSFGTTTTMFAMDLDLYNGLPADQQKAISDCGREVEVATAEKIDEDEGRIRDEIAANGGVMYELTPEQLAAFQKEMEPVEADFVKKLDEVGVDGAKALAEYAAALGR